MNYAEAKAIASSRLSFGDPSAIAAKRLLDRVASLKEELRSIDKEGEHWFGHRVSVAAEIEDLKAKGLGADDSAFGRY